MENLLVSLAQKATWDRLLPFPDKYRLTTQNGQPHTKEEHAYFINALHEKEPEAVRYATTINLDIAKHNENSLHPTITEFEFQYSYIDNYIKNLKYPRRWYLFHGSPLGNWHSILRSGIKNMSGTRFMSSGQALGPGVYATSSLRTASQYGVSGRNNIYVAVLELLVDPVQYLKNPTIYVIPDDKVLFPRYLYVLDAAPSFEGQEVLAYYKKLREGLIKPNTKVKRLLLDKADIKKYIVEDVSNICIILNINGILFRCYVVSYPFKAPVLQLCNTLTTECIWFDDYGCYKYPYEEWTAQNNLLMVINQLIKEVDLEKLQLKKEEYRKLEDL